MKIDKQAININKITHGGKIWIDLHNPTRSQLLKLMKDHNLHEDDIRAVTDNIVIPKTFEHKNYLFIAIHLPEISETSNVTSHEIDIFFSKKVIITSHKHQLNFFDDLFEHVKGNLPENFPNTAHILLEVLGYITENTHQITDQLAKDTRALEKNILSSKNEYLISQILHLRKEIIELSSITQPNLIISKEITASHQLERNFHPYIIYFDSLVENQEKNLNMIRHYSELITSLTDIANIISNYRFNDIIRILTIVSVTLMPLTLIAGILGMNFRLSFFQMPYGFTITIIFMIILEIIIIQYFKYKKWF